MVADPLDHVDLDQLAGPLATSGRLAGMNLDLHELIEIRPGEHKRLRDCTMEEVDLAIQVASSRSATLQAEADAMASELRRRERGVEDRPQL
jgi:hypothetical protein